MPGIDRRRDAGIIPCPDCGGAGWLRRSRLRIWERLAPVWLATTLSVHLLSSPFLARLLARATQGRPPCAVAPFDALLYRRFVTSSSNRGVARSAKPSPER